VTVPHLPFHASEKLISTLQSLPFDPSYLRYGCCLEYARAEEKLGFTAQRTSGDTLRALKECF
jgi:hypothetical protein